MPHPPVMQLRFTRSEFLCAVDCEFVGSMNEEAPFIAE